MDKRKGFRVHIDKDGNLVLHLDDLRKIMDIIESVESEELAYQMLEQLSTTIIELILDIIDEQDSVLISIDATDYIM